MRWLLPWTIACGPAGAPPEPASAVRSAIGGTVRGPGGPLAGAIVRIRAGSARTVTDPWGRFALEADPGGSEPVVLTAWAPEHYIGHLDGVQPGQRDLELALDPLPGDDPDYDWIPSLALPGLPDGVQPCERCHASGESGPGALPVDQWRGDAHARSATNPRFLSMYAGSHVDGRASPPARILLDPEYGPLSLPPDPDAPWFGPGFRLDNPDIAGNCAACHAPAAAAAHPLATDPRALGGAEAEGMPCDLCHKVADVALDPETGLPDPALPGVLSTVLRRPSPERQLFLGPLDDVAPGDDSYAEVFSDSRFCAPCHYGVFWNTLIYGSFAEWLGSPYSDRQRGRRCQDCHMPPTGGTRFARPDGLQRDPATLAGHRMPGAADARFVAAALGLELDAVRSGDRIEVGVRLHNRGAGHHLPTGSPLRHLILVVSAEGDGGALPVIAGPILPGWTGDRAGRPGRVYAKVLQDLRSGEVPTAAYWNPIRLIEDTRLPALATDRPAWTFAAPPGTVRVEVEVVFRRAFAALAARKGWSDPDLEVARRTVWIRE